MDDSEFQQALAFAQAHPTSHALFDQPRIAIGRREELSHAEHKELGVYLRDFGPWRKGPFEIFGHAIDANWKCDLKWDRVLEFADSLADRTVCDVGTGNGYYLFRMSSQEPRSVLGLDPTIAFQQSFEFLNAFYPVRCLQFQAAGFEELAKTEYAGRFDTIFCLGIVYHHPDPIRLLRILHAALRPGGQLIVESLGLPENYARDPVALTPAKGKYAGGGGTWHVPNALGLEQWLRRSGLRDVVARGEYDFLDEQIRTAELPGLREFLNPSNAGLTIEGYPTPVRMYFSARR